MPGDLALVTDPGAPGGILTCAELDSRTSALADRLCDVVSEAGAGVCAVEVGNDKTSAAILTLIAALRTDIPIVFRDQSATEDEQLAVRDRLYHAGVTVIGSEPADNGLFIHRGTPDIAAHVPATVPRHAVILASSGTTGRPKLTINTTLRQPTTRARAPRVTTRLNWNADQTQLVIGRLHHAAPLTFFIYGLMDGNRLLVPPRFEASSAIRLIEEHRVHWFQATPVHLQRMAAALQRRDADVDCLRGVLHMSAPCPPSVKQFWINRLGPDRIFEIYGATEGIGMTVASGSEWSQRPGTVGQGFFTQVRVLDDAMAPLPARTTGHVFLRSLSTSASRYLSGAGGLRTSPDGFRSVGDYGYLDEGGYLFLEPRRTDLINVGGENVYPGEIEEALAQCPGIAQAAVTGVLDERLGARPVAFVTCWPGATLTERDLIAFCRGHLSRFKLPKRVFFTDEIPHNRSGKVDRRELQAMVQAMEGR
jgi:bile acid-coenzyme A ligase